MKGLLKITCGVLALPFLCGIAFVVAYVVIVGIAIPQLPSWAQPSLTQWLLDIPQDSDNYDAPAWNDYDPTRAFSGTWTNYMGQNAEIIGIPLQGPLTKWGEVYEKPLLGCTYHDPNYSNHTGVDFPVDVGTPLHAVLSGEVVWAGMNGPWGRLVVIENSGYQVWLAHFSEIYVEEGQTVERGDILGLSGGDPSDPGSGNSSGPHLHYGIKQRDGDDYWWVNPNQFFSSDDYLPWGCSD